MFPEPLVPQNDSITVLPSTAFLAGSWCPSRRRWYRVTSASWPRSCGLGGGVDVGAGLGEQVGHALIGIEGNLIGGLHVLDGFGADGNLGTGIVLDLDRSRSRVIDEVRQLVGGEGELAAHVQAVASRTTVVAAVLVPYDGDILIVVAQVVYREVVPTGDFDRV